MAACIKSIRARLQPSTGPRVQILSDLHLEIGQQYEDFSFPVSAPFLLLAGDIGRLIDYAGFIKFLEAQVARYEKVFLLLGNHEFYDMSYETGIEKARQLTEEPSIANKVIFLHKTRWDDPNSGLTILGCTLWSAIRDEARSIIESKISDFKKIEGWTTQKHDKIHSEEVAWLREEIRQLEAQDTQRARRLLVATHHAPCKEGISRPEHTSNPWTPAFATDLIAQEGWDRVKTWVYGHTHYSTDFVHKGIRVVANQRGYVFPGMATLQKDVKKKRRRAIMNSTRP